MDDELITRAMKAYARRFGPDADIPSHRLSFVHTDSRGRKAVVLRAMYFGAEGTTAIYRVSSSRLRWVEVDDWLPIELEHLSAILRETALKLRAGEISIAQANAVSRSTNKEIERVRERSSAATD